MIKEKKQSHKKIEASRSKEKVFQGFLSKKLDLELQSLLDSPFLRGEVDEQRREFSE